MNRVKPLRDKTIATVTVTYNEAEDAVFSVSMDPEALGLELAVAAAMLAHNAAQKSRLGYEAGLEEILKYAHTYGARGELTP